MLNQLTIKNLAIVTQLDLQFDNGMSVITGETGAGKSILIDALSLALGERSNASHIRSGQTQAEITASFDISKLITVQQLLQQQDLADDECIIRRVIGSDSRSRAYINGVAVTAQQLKELAPYLVHIHSQHQHHALLDSDYQRQLLDSYAEHPELLQQVNNLYRQWLATKQQIEQLIELQQHADRLELLNYQLQELELLNLQDNELQLLDQKHQQLAKGQELLAICNQISALLTGDNDSETNNILDQLHVAANQLGSILKLAPQLTSSAELLQQAIIQVQEANTQLHDYFAKLDLDPQQLQSIETRLSTIHALARKLKVTPEMLATRQQDLRSQHEALTQATERLQQLQEELTTIENHYQSTAQKLSQSRQTAANKLSAAVIVKLKTLEMPNAKFQINCEATKLGVPAPYGNETINFMVTTNPGQPLALLRKIASGGELSRISLAIQVITAQQMAVPTLILDEVDSGISGKTAATVGALMRELGANAQILCITHLPQVAAQGQHHFKVEKIQTKQETRTQILPLEGTERVKELARLMGGATITPEGLAHARQLLEATV